LKIAKVAIFSHFFVANWKKFEHAVECNLIFSFNAICIVLKADCMFHVFSKGLLFVFAFSFFC